MRTNSSLLYEIQLLGKYKNYRVRSIAHLLTGGTALYFDLVLPLYQHSTTWVRSTLTICVLAFCQYHMTFPIPKTFKTVRDHMVHSPDMGHIARRGSYGSPDTGHMAVQTWVICPDAGHMAAQTWVIWPDTGYMAAQTRVIWQPRHGSYAQTRVIWQPRHGSYGQTRVIWQPRHGLYGSPDIGHMARHGSYGQT